MTSSESPAPLNPFEAPEAADLLKPRPFGVKFFAVCAVIVAGILFLLMPMTRRASQAAHRTQCQNNLKNITLAIISYAEQHKQFPPAYTTDASGKPLHSWRTLILPYLDQHSLYDQIDLSKPWDDPVNAAAMQKMPSSYSCPALNAGSTKTGYVVIVGPESMMRGNSSMSPLAPMDSPGQTFLVVEVPKSRAVEWMSPVDISPEDCATISTFADSPHTGVFLASMADGTVRTYSRSIDASVLKALTTANGGETLNDNDF